MRDGELITTGKVGGEVTPEEATECAQQCALNAIAAVKAEIGDLALIKRIVKVVCFVASTPDFTGSAAGRQRRVAPVRRGLRRRRGARAVRRRRTRAAARLSRSRSRSSSRSESVRPMERLPLPQQLVQQAAEYADGSRSAGRAA